MSWIEALTWADWWSAVQGIALAVAAAIAWYQISALRDEQRSWETLKACAKYSADPVLDRALCRLRDGRNGGDLLKNPKAYSLEAATVLNYLEEVATAVDQGFYDVSIVRDHLELIMRDTVAEFLSPAMSVRMEFEGLYKRLQKLLASWTSNPTYYRKRGR